MSNRVRLAGESQDGNRVIFEMISARIAEQTNDNKKHVIYMVEVRHLAGAGREDINPMVLERRYTDFYNMYTALKQTHSDLLSSVSFPRKVLMGNFDKELITTRRTGFESLLKLISSDSRLLHSNAVISFLQDNELHQANHLMHQMNADVAIVIYENNFRLLNKVYTDHSRPVLLALCRLLSCAISVPGSHAHKWAELALHRYNGVSDSELLTLYVPLLHLSIKLYKENNKDTTELEERLKNLYQRGTVVTNNLSFVDAFKLLD